MKPKYEHADRDKLSSKEKKEYDQYLKLKTEVESRRKSAKINLDNIEQSEETIIAAIDALALALGDKPLTAENLNNIVDNDSKSLSMGIAIAKQILQDQVNSIRIAELKKFILQDFKEGKEHYFNELNYAFNPDFNPRNIVGDDYKNVNERYYGNNDVEGPDATHGTHVAGLIAAKRLNGLGMDGIADHVRIMSVRCVPDGDERDKDVANAIRYAVDNGASIINMSFGKGNSPSKDAVDEAIRYAEKHDVLLVHAAGNAGTDNDKIENFPNKIYKKKKFLACNKASNWVEVGASSFETGPDMVAGFSNYGKKNVDLFSPGVQIYSTIPGSKYENLQGTSMASPIAAGVAAMIRSYYPKLNAKQVRNILVQSAVKQTELIKQPGTKKDVHLSEISISGGTINAFEAIKLAAKTKGKKKISDSDLYDSDDSVKSNTNPRS
jgi:subtilisin family serine protease